jgi:hypothetical protein
MKIRIIVDGKPVIMTIEEAKAYLESKGAK